MDTPLRELKLNQQLYKALDKLAFINATEVQAKAIPLALAGQDLMVSAKTGSGKTAAFMLPMLERFLAVKKAEAGARGLILLPTRELAIQTQKVFQELAAFTTLQSGLIIGGEAYKPQLAIFRNNPEVLIATPGRLLEHIEKGNADLTQLEILVLDEADRMLDMGFAEPVQKITNACNPDRQTYLFSATLKHKGFNLLGHSLKDPVRITPVRASSGHSQIAQQMVLADDDKHKENLVAALVAEEQASKVFIFCKTRAQAQNLSNVLRYKKLRAGCIHGEISQNDRKRVMNLFLEGELQVLVATDVAARGLDVKDMDLVINFTVARSGDDHVHRAGRTGRAGRQGKAITLVNAAEWNFMSSIERYLKIRLAQRKVKGLEAKYKGPKKIKKSGKAAGKKKKKNK